MAASTPGPCSIASTSVLSQNPTANTATKPLRLTNTFLLHAHAPMLCGRFWSQLEHAWLAPALGDLSRPALARRRPHGRCNPLPWHIWKARNAKIFDQRDSDPTDIISRVITDINKWSCRCSSSQDTLQATLETLTLKSHLISFHITPLFLWWGYVLSPWYAKDFNM